MIKRGFCLAAISIVLCACGGLPGSSSFWRTGRDYRLTIVVESREAVPVGFRGTDSTDIFLHVDSIAGDSAYGTFTTELWQIGLRVGRIGAEQQRFHAITHADSVSLTLVPDARDAGLHMRGANSAAGAAAGHWHTEAVPRSSGRFSLRLRARPG